MRVTWMKSNPEKADAERHTDVTYPSNMCICRFMRGRLCCPTCLQVALTHFLLRCNPDHVTLQGNRTELWYFGSICEKWKLPVVYQPFFPSIINYRQLFLSVIRSLLSFLPRFTTLQSCCGYQRRQEHEEDSNKEAASGGGITCQSTVIIGQERKKPTKHLWEMMITKIYLSTDNHGLYRETLVLWHRVKFLSLSLSTPPRSTGYFSFSFPWAESTLPSLCLSFLFL